jgi:hypothetical protein
MCIASQWESAMNPLLPAVVLVFLALGPATAADLTASPDSDVAFRAARVEALRARSSATPALGASSALLEADSLLQRMKQAPPKQREALGSQLDVLLGRLELTLDAARSQDSGLR